MAIQERDPRQYELMTVFIPDLSEEDNQAQIERTERYISSAGGSLTETLTSSPWGRRRLAYTIRFNGIDYRDGYYTVFHFDSRPLLLAELERELKFDTNVMRYLLVHDDPKAGERHTEDAAEGEGDTEAGSSDSAQPAPAATTATAQSNTEGDEAAASTDPVESLDDDAPAQDIEAVVEVASDAEGDAPSGSDEAPADADEPPTEDVTSGDDTSDTDKE